MGYSLTPGRKPSKSRGPLPGQVSRAGRGAGKVLAAIVSTPADRRAPRESGDVGNGTIAAGDGCRGEVPRTNPDIPPAGRYASLSQVPTGLAAVGRTGRRAEGHISQSRKARLYAFFKKWAPSQKPPKQPAGDPYWRCSWALHPNQPAPTLHPNQPTLQRLPCSTCSTPQLAYLAAPTLQRLFYTPTNLTLQRLPYTPTSLPYSAYPAAPAPHPN